MSRYKAGERVFAIRNADDDTVYLYGFGTYVGDKLRPGTVLATAENLDPEIVEVCRDSMRRWDEPEFRESMETLNVEAMRKDGKTDEDIAAWKTEFDAKLECPFEERVVEHAIKTTNGMNENPCIVLDSGDIVWGMQCWWGSEDQYKDRILGDKKEVIVQVPA